MLRQFIPVRIVVREEGLADAVGDDAIDEDAVAEECWASSDRLQADRMPMRQAQGLKRCFLMC